MENGFILWFTGMSGSGKTTISKELSNLLIKTGYKVQILDSDYIRNTSHKNLGFSRQDIEKNNTGLAELALSYAHNCDFVIVPIISPFNEVRKKAREIIKNNFLEIYLKCGLKELTRRDTKGYYKKSLEGGMKNLIGFPGSEIPYEEPRSSNLVLQTDKKSTNECTKEIYDYLMKLV